MSLIDRVQRRTDAFSVLGVSSSASQQEIRQAYRKLAFTKHPDRQSGNSGEFAKINEAYKYVCENADELGIPKKPAPFDPRRVSRPAARPSDHAFDMATIAACNAALSAERPGGAQHVATRVYRVGRNLTYFVPSKVLAGENAVAVPTGMLHDNRQALPKVLSFDSNETHGGMFEMSADDCAKFFPGARRVQIRFERI